MLNLHRLGLLGAVTTIAAISFCYTFAANAARISKVRPIDRFVFLMNGDDSFVGGSGDDIVDGGLGNDTLDGGAGSNTLYYLNRTSGISVTLNGAKFSSTSVGASEVDKIKNFKNVITGSGTDTIIGDSNNNVFEGGAGGDYLNGGSGSDTASYAHSKTAVSINLKDTSGNTGDAFGDQFVSIENLEGSTFNDVLVGNDGANTFIANAGADILTGNLGNDIFKYLSTNDSRADSPDFIMDFNAGINTSVVDMIDLSAIDADANMPNRQAFKFIGNRNYSNPGVAGELRVYQNGSDTYIESDTFGTGKTNFRIVLKNFSNLAGLTAKDFKL